jgi:hypothetical protein
VIVRLYLLSTLSPEARTDCDECAHRRASALVASFERAFDLSMTGDTKANDRERISDFGHDLELGEARDPISISGHYLLGA